AGRSCARPRRGRDGVTAPSQAWSGAMLENRKSSTPVSALPAELEPRRLARRALQACALLGALVLVVLFAPGLDAVSQRLGEARPAWIAAAVALELLSCLSYVALFRPVFCRRMSWRLSSRIAWSELGVGSLV